MFDSVLSGKRIGYLVSLLGTAAVTALLVPFRDEINSTTTSLAYLLAGLCLNNGVCPKKQIDRAALAAHGRFKGGY